MQKMIIAIGLFFILLGIMWPYLSRLGIGHLPGYIIIKRDNFTFYFPLATCIIISIIISLLWYLLRK